MSEPLVDRAYGMHGTISTLEHVGYEVGLVRVVERGDGELELV